MPSGIVTGISDEELRLLPNTEAEFDSQFVRKRILEMEWRTSERQLEAAKQLFAFTKGLVTATRVLALATGALFFASVLQIVVMLKK